MPSPRYRCTWDDIAYLDADHMAGWGAFTEGCRETIDFDDDTLPRLAYEMGNREFSAAYQWCSASRPAAGDFIRSRVFIDARPCRFGGTRSYFTCPTCARRTLRLAVLPEGLRCGNCGRVTWGSRREQPTHRLVRRANKIALRLGCDSWQEQPTTRPAHMRLTTYDRLIAERRKLVDAINLRLAVRLSRSGLFQKLAYMAKL